MITYENSWSSGVYYCSIDLIGVEESKMPILLSYRDVLMQELLGGSGRGDQREVQ